MDESISENQQTISVESSSLNDVQDMESITKRLKESIKNCKIVEDKAIKIKVRRKHTFVDFVGKFRSTWVRSQVGCSLSIEYYGECGVDQGGLSREFFSGLC